MERKITCPKCGAENLSWRSRCQQCGEELQKDVNMVRFHSRSVFYRWALISGLVGAGMAGFVLWFVFAFATGHITDPISWLFILFPLCTVGIAFRWPVAGGVLLTLEGLALTGLFILAFSLALPFLASIQSNSPFQWLLLVPIFTGLILLASGILFLISRRPQKQREGA